MSTTESQKLSDRAIRSITAGTHSNSRIRAPHPLYFARAEGAYVWDVDGNRYCDLGMGNGAVMLGHKHPAVQKAVAASLANGLTAGLESEVGVRAAELFLKLVPSAERVRFANTGTEAMIHVLQMARAITAVSALPRWRGPTTGGLTRCS